jgi:hypothetical protein
MNNTFEMYAPHKEADIPHGFTVPSLRNTSSAI